MDEVSNTNEVIRCILERRSIRAYNPELIPKEELDLILQAGIYAPKEDRVRC